MPAQNGTFLLSSVVLTSTFVPSLSWQMIVFYSNTREKDHFGTRLWPSRCRSSASAWTASRQFGGKQDPAKAVQPHLRCRRIRSEEFSNIDRVCSHIISTWFCVNRNEVSPSSRPKTPAQMFAAVAAVVYPISGRHLQSFSSTRQNARADEILRIFSPLPSMSKPTRDKHFFFGVNFL